MRELILLLAYAGTLYLGVWGLYDLLLSLAAKFTKSEEGEESEQAFFYVVIPAFREGEVLLQTIERALAVDYPKSNFEVVVLAQDLSPEILNAIRSYPISIIETGAMGSKMKAIKNWLLQIQHDNAHLFILDADNLIKYNALKLSSAALESSACVQLQREKTMPSSPLAILDRWNTDMGLIIANHSRMVLGLSPFILGSGFAIKASLYADFVRSADDTIVEDKALDMYLIGIGEHPRYVLLPGVEDATISRNQDLQTQRSRWVSGRVFMKKQMRKAYFNDMLNIELFDKWLHYSSPQRSLRLALAFIWLLFALVFPVSAWVFALPITLGALAVLLATPKHLLNTKLVRALLAVPGSILIIAKSRLAARSTLNQSFKVTPK